MHIKRGIIYVSLKQDGKWVRKSTGLKDTKENRRKVLLLEVQEKPRLLFPPFSQLADEFIKTKRNNALGTVDSYQRTIDYFLLANSDVQPRLITDQHIDIFKDFLTGKGLAQNTISSHIRNLRIIFNYFKEKGYIEKNLVKRIPQKEKPIKIIPDNLMNDFLTYLKSKNLRHYRFIKLLTLTGFRTGEAIELTWENIQFDNNRIVMRNIKGNRSDEFPLNETLKNFLLEFRSTGSIFNYKSTDSLKWLKKVFTSKLKGYSFHDIRRTFATKLLIGNVNPYVVMKLMRHKDFKTTMKHYAYIQTLEMGGDLERVMGTAGTNSPTLPNATNDFPNNEKIISINLANLD